MEWFSLVDHRMKMEESGVAEEVIVISQEPVSGDCLICSTGLTSEPSPSKFNTDLLLDLCKILKISSTFLDHVEIDQDLWLPCPLYCASCEDTIRECLKVFEEIKDRERVLDSLVSKIKTYFIASYCLPYTNYDENYPLTTVTVTASNLATKENRNNFGSNQFQFTPPKNACCDAKFQIRKTFAQCWSNCTVNVNRCDATRNTRTDYILRSQGHCLENEGENVPDKVTDDLTSALLSGSSNCTGNSNQNVTPINTGTFYSLPTRRCPNDIPATIQLNKSDSEIDSHVEFQENSPCISKNVSERGEDQDSECYETGDLEKNEVKGDPDMETETDDDYDYVPPVELPSRFLPKNIKKKTNRKTKHVKSTSVTCDIDNCNQTFSNKKLLRVHETLNHEDKSKRAKGCVLNFDASSGQLLSFICSFCKKEYTRTNSVNREETAYQCDIVECEKTYPLTQFQKFASHHEFSCEQRPKDTFECEFCSKHFFNKTNLDNHRISFHTKQYPHYCDECGKGQASLTLLNTHKRNVHRGNIFQCTVQGCETDFKTKKEFIFHMRRHNGDLRYICRFCGKKFLKTPHLHKHEALHTAEEGAFSCDICGKTFRVERYLRHHVWTVHEKSRKKRTNVAPRRKKSKNQKPQGLLPDGGDETATVEAVVDAIISLSGENDQDCQVAELELDDNIIIIDSNQDEIPTFHLSLA